MADPTYRTDVHPMLSDLLPSDHSLAVDLGCGEGQGMRLVGAPVIGVDRSVSLLEDASASGPVVAIDLPDMRAFRAGSFDLAYAVYLVDLLSDIDRFFTECARIVAPGGTLVVIVNHPVFTAPGAVPLMDDDGEVLWRWGSYFARGWTEEPAGGRTVRFHHRSMSDLLTTAAESGWRLEEVCERPLSPEAIAELPGYVGQAGIPRLLGVRWTLAGASATAR